MRASLWSDEVTAKRKAAHLALILLIWASVLVGTVLAPPTARAAETPCPPAPAVLAGPHDNVVVPRGQTCLIIGATIKGNVKALEDSHLRISNSTVGGSIDGDRAEEMRIFTTTIGGNIHVREGDVPNGQGAMSDVAICRNTLPAGNIIVEKTVGSIVIGRVAGDACLGNQLNSGNIQVSENRIVQNANGTGLQVEENIVGSMDDDGLHGGDLQVFKNRNGASIPAAKSVMANQVLNGVIQCYENQPPFLGGPNVGEAPESVIVSLAPLVTAPNQCSGT